MTCDSRFPLKILVKCDPFEIVFLPGCFIFVTVVVFFFFWLQTEESAIIECDPSHVEV